MLAFITSYWFITLPTVVTGAYLLRVLKKTQEQKEKKVQQERIHVRSRHNQLPQQYPHQ
jgi:hypothetical protein